jgi:recombination protein RecA
MSADDLERFLAHAAEHARGSAASAKLLSLDALRARRGDALDDAAAAAQPWSLGSLRGRLVELSARGASATLTAAIDVVAQAQAESEPVAWLTLATSTFYPPDVADSGVDLAALVVIQAPTIIALARAAERCLRSGAFGLVVLDLGAPRPGAELSMQIQGRLVTLAQTHDAAVVCLTEKTQDAASLGSLVSLRAEALRIRREPADRFVRPAPTTVPVFVPAQGGDALFKSAAPHVVLAALAHRASSSSPPPSPSSPSSSLSPSSTFDLEISVLKDKRRGPGGSIALERQGPGGF